MNIFKRIIILFVLIGVVFCAVSLAFAQQRAELYSLYEQNHTQALRQVLKNVAPAAADDYELLFFQALFVKDGEQAEQKYLSVFEHGSARLKLMAAKKLMEYFYAAGYYVTSEKYQKYIVEHETPVAKTDALQPVRDATSVKYFIQVGAFGLPENARQRVAFLKTQDVKSRLVERVINSKTLYCVWIEGKKDLDKSLEYTKKIKQKFDLEFQIMKK